MARRLPILFLLLPLAAAPGVGAEGRAFIDDLGRRLAAAEQAVAHARYEAAAELYRDVIDASEALPRPNLPQARATDGLGDVMRLRGRLEEAVELYDRSSAMWARLLGDRQPRRAVTLHNLGAVYLRMGRPADAVEPLRLALEIWNATFGPGSDEARNTRGLLERSSNP